MRLRNDTPFSLPFDFVVPVSVLSGGPGDREVLGRSDSGIECVVSFEFCLVACGAVSPVRLKICCVRGSTVTVISTCAPAPSLLCGAFATLLESTRNTFVAAAPGEVGRELSFLEAGEVGLRKSPSH